MAKTKLSDDQNNSSEAAEDGRNEIATGPDSRMTQSNGQDDQNEAVRWPK